MAKLFGTSGIRGIFGKEITLELGIKIGEALGTYLEKGTALIGRDTRTHSLALENSIASGLESSGIAVLRAGLAPTPVLAFSAREFKTNAGVMITASHNPPEYNGVKLFNNDSSAYMPSQENEIEKILLSNKMKKVSWESIKKSQNIEVNEKYIEFIKKQVQIEDNFKIALDCGNGACSVISPLVLEEFSTGLESIFTKTDGTFPRKLEPKSENLSELKKLVKKSKADVGFAHDGDGDRVAVVDEAGNFVDKDKLLALLAGNELEQGASSRKKIVVPIDTSKLIEDVALEYSAEVVYSKVGDVSVAEYLKKYNGIFGGEPSGCFIFPDAHLCPDGILASLKILELLFNSKEKISELVKKLPAYHTIREEIKCKAAEKEKIVKKLSKKIKSLPRIEKISEIDGTRADFPDAWVLARASGTEPMVRITVESKSLERAKELIKKVI